MRKGMMVGGRQGNTMVTAEAVKTASEQYWYEGRYYDKKAKPPVLPTATATAILQMLTPILADPRLWASLGYRTDLKRFYLSVHNNSNSQGPRLCFAFREQDVLLFEDNQLDYGEDYHPSRHDIATLPYGDDLGERAYRLVIEKIREDFDRLVANFQSWVDKYAKDRAVFNDPA